MRICRQRWNLLGLPFILITLLTIGCTAVASETSTEVTPPPPPVLPVINCFTATPETINPGQAVTLSWDVSGAAAVTIHPRVDTVTPSGTIQLAPTTTTVYTLTATNEAGSITRKLTISVSPADDTLVGFDPVTGRNQDIGFTWEQLYLSDQYQVQIANDADFSQIIFDSGAIAPASYTSPALVYPAGRLHAGHTYYWRARVRRAATGQIIHGPWSKVESFTVGTGLPTTSKYQGVQLLSPYNNCAGCPVRPVSFSWSPLKETSKYRFIMARDMGMSDIIATAEVSGTSYVYEGTLEYSTSYFWQVMALEPAPSDPSAAFCFTTEAKPSPVPPVIEAPPPATPTWVWVVIGTGTVLIIVILILIFKARKS